MENLIEDQAIEEWAFALLALALQAHALQQPGHNVSTLSLTFQRVFRLRDSLKIKQVSASLSLSPVPAVVHTGSTQPAA